MNFHANKRHGVIISTPVLRGSRWSSPPLCTLAHRHNPVSRVTFREVVYAGKIADELGAFVQLTYDGAADHFALDNTDIRYAHHLSFGGSDANGHNLIVGVTLNNNPTVQDVWNSTPAWGFPYSGSRVAPGPIASAKIDSGAGGFGQNVAGLGVYVWLDDHFYAELTGYTAAIRGGAHGLDSTQNNVVHGLSPYWRLAYEQRWDRNSMSIGAYGIEAKVHPGNGTALQGVTDQYRDAAADVQYQFIGEDHLATVLATYIHERQTQLRCHAPHISLRVDVMISGLADYFAKQSAAQGRSGNAVVVAQGRHVFEEGVPARQIPPCASCHGAHAEGRGPFPRLAGQHAPYLLKQLLVIQNVLRTAPVMHGVIKDLTREQMQAVVGYLESI